MKKLFFIAAIAGAALVSCTKNELAPSATEQHELIFANPVTSTLTKVVDLATGTQYPTTAPFYVFADYHIDQFSANGTSPEDVTSYMRGDNGVLVTHKTTEITINNQKYDEYWSADKKYYWPMDGYLTFAAYSTGTTTSLIGGTDIEYTFEHGLKVKDYTISNDNTNSATYNQYDLMLSKRALNQEKTTMKPGNDVYDGVQIQFEHALSAIKFAVCAKENYATDGYEIKLKSITIENAYNQADLTQFESYQDLNLSTIWSGYDIEDADYVAFTSTNGMVVPYNYTNDALVPTNVSDGDADIVLIPQGLDHTSDVTKTIGTGNEKVTVKIVYTVHHKDMGEDSITYTKYFPLTGTTATISNWEAGKRYIYTIIFGMEEIVFAPTIVKDWGDVNINIEVPKDEIK